MELWDIYDKDRNPAGRTHVRGVPMEVGDYHLVVHIWIQNAMGNYLISRRAPGKQPYEGLWECTGGSAVTGDDSLTAALREVREELGIELDPANGRMIRTVTGADAIEDIWLFHQEVDLSDITFQETETCDAMWATPDDIRAMLADGSFVPVFGYLEWLFAQKRTTVYFVRHAESDQSVRQDDVRPLTDKGMADARALVGKFDGIHLDVIYSSPYLRAEQTVLPLAKSRRMPIYEQWDFRERKVDSCWIEDYDAFAKRQWADHEYKLSDGESIADAQRRNIAALNALLDRYGGKSILIGTHGGCMGAILNHYDKAFGYAQFRELLPKLPCVMKLTFLGERCVETEELFARQGVVPVDSETRAVINGLIEDSWDSPFIASRGRLTDSRLIPGFAYMKDGEVRGYAMYSIDGAECELAVLEVLDEGEGAGSALLARVIDEARRAGCGRMFLVTSNDNTHAIRFYQRRGMELCAVRLGAMDEARRTIKPQIPEKGLGGIPIRHEFEFEVKL